MKPEEQNADRWAAEFVKARAGYTCQNCGKECRRRKFSYLDRPCEIMEWAHIVARDSFATRWDPDNAFCLCTDCHRHFTGHPIEFREFAISTLGQEKYSEVLKKGQQISFWYDRDPAAVAKQLRADTIALCKKKGYLKPK